jgi:glc operon protein GlcG
VRSVQIIQYAEAQAIVAACESASIASGVASSVAVLDAFGRTVLLARFDGAPWQTPEVAQGKALTSVMMRKPSKAIEDVTLQRLTLTTFNDGRLPIQGGFPLMVDGVCVGAVGVSGGTPDQDEAQAQAGVDAFNGMQ